MSTSLPLYLAILFRSSATRKFVTASLVFIFLIGTHFRAIGQYVYNCEGGHFVHFHGINGYVDAEDPNINPSGITLAAWVRCELKNPSDMSIIYRKFDAHQQIWTTIEYGLVVNHKGEFAFIGAIDTTVGKTNSVVTEYNTRGQEDSLSSGFIPDSGIFYHVAVTLDPVNFSCNIYVNGVLKASKTMKGGLHWANDGSGNQYNASIGASSYYIFNGTYYNSNYFNGYIDDAFESGLPLNKSQIDSIAGGKSLKEIPLMNYQFNEGNGTSTVSNPGVQFNSNNYGNTGSLVGDCAWVSCTSGSIVANAGPNMTITLPVNDTILNGSLSSTTGNDGPIISYNWQQIAGPAQSTILSPATVTTHVNFPLKGLYTFSLQIKDQAGKTSTANVQVNVLPAWANKQDSSALVDLYNKTNGIYWLNQSGWLAGPVRNWNGVTITDDSGRVTSVFLGNNNLSGVIPSTIANLTDLTSLNISNNKLTFDGMELLAQRFGGFASYSPQDSISIAVAQGIFNVTAGGTITNNTYSWYLNGQLDTIIYGNPAYKPRANGQYYAAVTNSISKQLTLYSHRSDNVDTLPNFVLIDPNPSMINADGTLNTNSANIKMSPIVIGGATDGITKILIVAITDKAITFSLSTNSDGSISSLDGSLSEPAVNVSSANGKVVIVYTVPDGYGANNNPGSRNIIITASDARNPSLTKDVSIKLITPPVILVHGMWSKPAVWYEGGFINALAKSGVSIYPNNLVSVYTADYSTNSASTFDPASDKSAPGLGALQNAINSGLKNYRSNKIAVTQVDVVGHSLGGLMARSLSQQSSFIDISNYQKGYIHKLITLGTPHRGSPIGPVLWNHQFDQIHIYNPLAWLALGASLPTTHPVAYTAPLNVYMSYAGRPIGLCHKDFGKDSEGISDLKATPPFYAYAITGNYFPNASAVLAFDAINALLYCATDSTYADVFLSSECKAGFVLPNSDLMVEVNSQTGGLTNNKNFLGTYHNTIIPGTNTETNSPDIQNTVIGLLLSDSPSSVFSTTGFPSPSVIASDCKNGTNYATKKSIVRNSNALSTTPPKQNEILSLDNFVQITSPIHGISFLQNANSNVNLQFNISGNIIPSSSLFIVKDIGSYLVSNQPPYSISFNLPNNISLGSHNIVLFVKDSITGQVYADTTSIQIVPASNLDSISVNPQSLYLDSAGRTSSAYVQGYFAGGQPYNISDISSSSAGTTYKTQKGNSVFSVSPEGLITANKPGTDTLIVSNSGLSAKLAVTIDSNFILRTIYPNAIDFPAINSHVYGDAPFYLSATTTSGDDVNFSITSGNATIVNGILVITGAGPVTVKASNPGNAYFGAAADVYQTFCVSPGLAGAVTGDTVTCAAQKKYAVSSIPGASFQWKVSEGATVNSSDSSATITWLAPGKHNVTVTPIAGGCTGTATVFNVTVNSLSKPKIFPSENIQICNGANSLIQLNDSLGSIQWYLGTTPITSATLKSLRVYQPGNYFATITDSIGCAAISDTAFVVLANLAKPLISPADSVRLCSGDSTSLQINASSGNLQWYDDGISLANGTSNQITVSGAGTYYVTQTNNTGCVVNSDSVVVSVDQIANPTIAIEDSSITCSDSLTLKSNYVSGNQWYNDGTAIGGANAQYYIATKPGDYSVRVNNGTGCSGQSAEQTVTPGKIPATPTIKILGTELVSSSDSGNQWYMNDTLIPAANSNSFLPVDTGNYTVQTTMNGCTSAMSASYSYKKTAGTGPIVQIFPNPVYDHVSIVNRSPNLYTVQIFDVCGKLLTAVSHVSGSTQIRVSNYSRGQYVLLITDEITGIQIRSKLIKL